MQSSSSSSSSISSLLSLLAPTLFALAASGCTGFRLGPYGIGIATTQVRRTVLLRYDWSPDDRFVLISKQSTRSLERSCFLLIRTGGWDVVRPDRFEVYRVSSSGEERPARLGKGRGLKVCPAGTYAAFHEEYVPDKDAPPRHRLWLVDYAQPRPRPVMLGEQVVHYSFSHDGAWLSWASVADGTWTVARVDRPDERQALDGKLRTLSAKGWRTRRWGMPRDRWRWSADGCLYRLLTRWNEARRALDYRWVRLVPPDWRVEDLGESPAGAPPLTLREERPSRPHGLARSLDGSVRLDIRTVRRRRAGLLFLIGFPEAITEVQNVVLTLPDLSERPLTHFRASRW